MQIRLVLLPGDGIGPEVMAPTREVLARIAALAGHRVRFETHPIGGDAIDRTGSPLPDSTLDACREADAVLLGAVGGPRWDRPEASVRPEQGLLGLRKGLGLYANLRPVAPHPALLSASPIKADRLEGVDLMVVRELTGGLYFGDKIEHDEYAEDVCRYERHEIERVVRCAAELAQRRRGRLTLVDKANVLATSRLWRKVASGVVQRDYPEIEFDVLLVDAAAMHLISRPSSFDVLVTENLFGDILTDEASMLAGSMGLLPSASLGDGNGGLYEPIHGSAPDLAGTDTANPFGMLLSAAMMLRLSLGQDEEATLLETAVADCISDGQCTRDLGGSLSTSEAGRAVMARLERAAA